MRIAFIHPRFSFAEGTGATHSATQIVTGLADAGHDICVYCSRRPEENTEMTNLELRNLTGNSNHPHTYTRLNKEISSHLEELREFDVVHSYLARLIPSIARVGKDADIGTVITLNAYGGTCAKNDLLYHNREQCRSKSTFKWLNCIARSGFYSETNFLYETASQALSLRLIKKGENVRDYIDGFQALTPHVTNTYANFGYDREKIATIPNILDQKFDVEHESDFAEPIKLLYVGYLKQSKGADRLIEVLSQVNTQSDKEFHLTIVGDGDLRQSIEQECIDRDLTEDVDILGHVPNDDLPNVYANHDIFVYPGRWDEPFGRIFLEAMASGTPIVTTNIGSVKEIVGDGGVVTEEGINGLVDGVISVDESHELKTYSRKAKERTKEYKKESIIPQFEKLYRSVM